MYVFCVYSASRRGHLHAVRLLLEHGCDPNAKDNVGGYTAAQYSAHYKHYDVLRLLVSYGANINYHNKYNKPVIYYANKYNDIKNAIKEGLSDLYIIRCISAQCLIENNNIILYNYDNENITLNIALKIIEYIPRHQLPCHCKTKFITKETKTFNSASLFSQTKHHNNIYNSEFDIDIYSDSDNECYFNNFNSNQSEYRIDNYIYNYNNNNSSKKINKKKRKHKYRKKKRKYKVLYLGCSNKIFIIFSVIIVLISMFLPIFYT